MRAVIAAALAGFLGCLLTAGSAAADPPWRSLISFERVEADPNKEYVLTEKQGPWMILCASFSGPTAREDAHRLVLELRSDYKLPAYVWSKDFDFTEPVQARGVDRFGQPIRAHHAMAIEFKEFAVMVGDYPDIEDRELERDLERIKHAHPEALNLDQGQGQTQRFAGLRSLYRTVTGDEERGPMGSAFATPNPELPEGFFQQQGIDPIVREMNEGVEYSLLECPGRFTVQVARFRGRNTIQPDEIEAIESGRDQNFGSTLEQAAIKAHLITEALRQQGFEAYEYHDRQESVVCVGSFDQLYQLDPQEPYQLDENGQFKTDEHGIPIGNYVVDNHSRPLVVPGIVDLIQRFGPEQTLTGSQPKSIRVSDGRTLAFDLAPLPVVVPKVSIGDTYARSSLFGR